VRISSLSRHPPHFLCERQRSKVPRSRRHFHRQRHMGCCWSRVTVSEKPCWNSKLPASVKPRRPCVQPVAVSLRSRLHQHGGVSTLARRTAGAMFLSRHDIRSRSAPNRAGCMVTDVASLLLPQRTSPRDQRIGKGVLGLACFCISGLWRRPLQVARLIAKGPTG